MGPSTKGSTSKYDEQDMYYEEEEEEQGNS